MAMSTFKEKMISNRQHWFQARPTPLELKRKIEKSVVREAKDEEKNLKQVVKEMEETEKAAHRAQKGADKAGQRLSNAKMNKDDVLRALHKAEYDYDRALTDVHHAENNLQIKRRNLVTTQRSLQTKKTLVDAAFKANDYHTAERNAKMAALRGLAGNSEGFGVKMTGSRASATESPGFFM